MPDYHTKAAFLFSKISPLFGQKKVFENDRDMVYYQQRKEKNRRAEKPKNGPCAAEMIKYLSQCCHHSVGCMMLDPLEDTERTAITDISSTIQSCMMLDPLEDTESMWWQR